jgi:hypothetical protein
MVTAANDSQPSPSNWLGPCLALAEVVVAFVVVHSAYRATKQFTVVGEWERAAGANFTPGAVMIGMTLVMLWVCRRDFGSYGLSLTGWRYGLALGLAGSVVLLSIEAVGLLVTGIEFDGTRPPDPHRRLSLLRIIALASVALPAYAAVLILVQKRRALVDRIPAAASVIAIAGLMTAWAKRCFIGVTFSPASMWRFVVTGQSSDSTSGRA